MAIGNPFIALAKNPQDQTRPHSELPETRPLGHCSLELWFVDVDRALMVCCEKAQAG